MEYTTPTPKTMTSQTLTNIAPALVNAIAETKDVHADSKNPYHKNSYASLAAHLSALKPIFHKHGLAILQFPSSGFDGGIGVRTLVIHTSGEFIQCEINLPTKREEGTDKNGKPYRIDGYTGQEAGSVISYLRRYSLAAVACVATSDDDAEADRVSSPRAEPKFIPNLSVTSTQPAASVQTQLPVSGDIDPNILIPFGRSKGQAIGTLSKDDLKFWAESWEPRPYEKTGKVTKKDATLKATAVALFSGSVKAPQNLVDDVPFGDEENPY